MATSITRKNQRLGDDLSLLEDLAKGPEVIEGMHHPVFSGVPFTVEDYRAILARFAQARDVYVLFPYQQPRVSEGWLTMQEPPDAARASVLVFREGFMLAELPKHLIFMETNGMRDLQCAENVRALLGAQGSRMPLPDFYASLGKSLRKSVHPCCYALANEESLYTARWPPSGTARHEMAAMPQERLQGGRR